MKNDCAFAGLHPALLLLWFSAALTLTVLTLDPVIAVLSLIGAAAHRIVSERERKISVGAYLVTMTAVTLLNPLFSHHGVTVLFFLHDLPITLEALLYGAFMSCEIAAALLWCESLSACMTSDKVIYLVGKPAPKLAVLLSLTLRLLPLLKDEYRAIERAQRANGLLLEKSVFSKPRSAMRVFSALVTMALEDSIDTADSMQSRGVMLPHRSFYSDFRLHRRDIFALSAVLPSLFLIIAAMCRGCGGFTFYPAVSGIELTVGTVTLYISFFVFSIIPASMEVSAWKR